MSAHFHLYLCGRIAAEWLIDMNLGDIVKRYREDNHISMDEFAKRSNLSKGYISMLEKNKNPRSKKPIIPSLDTIKQVAWAMGMTLDSIIKQLDDDQEVSLIKCDTSECFIKRKDTRTPIQESLHLEKYRRLNTIGRQRIDQYLDELLRISDYTKIE